MAKIKQKISISNKEGDSIRRAWDKYTQEWNYSIADVMAILTESVDARNYWKVLKNRLKNSNKELVTNCNQLKMLANDGKYYMVDAANRGTIIKIIQIIAPYNVPAFESWFDHTEVVNSKKFTEEEVPIRPLPLAPKPATDFDEEKISTAKKIPVDVFEKKDKIVVRFFAPGINPSDIFVSISANFLLIKGNLKQNYVLNNDTDIIKKELSFGYFYRKIELPNLADVENIEATETNGMIEIKINKIDKNKERFIKIKSLS